MFLNKSPTMMCLAKKNKKKQQCRDARSAKYFFVTSFCSILNSSNRSERLSGRQASNRAHIHVRLSLYYLYINMCMCVLLCKLGSVCTCGCVCACVYVCVVGKRECPKSLTIYTCVLLLLYSCTTYIITLKACINWKA